MLEQKWFMMDEHTIVLNLPNGVIIKMYARNQCTDYYGVYDTNVGVSSVFVPDLVYVNGEFKLLGENNV